MYRFGLTPIQIFQKRLSLLITILQKYLLQGGWLCVCMRMLAWLLNFQVKWQTLCDMLLSHCMSESCFGQLNKKRKHFFSQWLWLVVSLMVSLHCSKCWKQIHMYVHVIFITFYMRVHMHTDAFINKSKNKKSTRSQLMPQLCFKVGWGTVFLLPLFHLQTRN